MFLICCIGCVVHLGEPIYYLNYFVQQGSRRSGEYGSGDIQEEMAEANASQLSRKSYTPSPQQSLKRSSGPPQIEERVSALDSM